MHPQPLEHRPRRSRALPAPRPRILALLLCMACCAWAQEEGPALKPTSSVVPRISVSETFTDNVNLSNTSRRAEQITEVSPGIRISRDSGRLTGYFDYALRALYYAQGSRDSTYLHALSTAGELDALNQWLFIDFSGDISQQSLNALGPLSTGNGYSPTNSAEVSHYSVSPFVQGVLGGAVDYNARFNRTITHAGNASSSDVGESLASVNLSSSVALSRLGWVADASRYNVDYSAGRGTEADQTDVGLRLAITPQLSAVAKVGREYSNYTSRDKQAHDTQDLSLSWQPSPLLQASASWGQRSYGDIHAASVEYHSPLVVVRLADRREVTAVPGQVLPVLLLPAQPVTGPGPLPSAPVIGYFITTAISLQDRQDLQVSLLGVRDTVTLGYSQSDYTRLDTLAQVTDELSRSTVHQALLSLDYSHRLTPTYDLGVTTALQKASGAPNQEDNLLRMLSVSLRGKVSRRGSASVGLRRAVSTGSAPYDETALTAALQVEF
jgi:hypothetical protein